MYGKYEFFELVHNRQRPLFAVHSLASTEGHPYCAPAMNKAHFFIIPLFALAFLLGGCFRANPIPTEPGQGSSSSMAATNPTPTAPSGNQFDGKILSGKHTVILKTSKGNITIELNADAAPKTATNFYWLAKTGFYNGLSFHRIIPGFMIQGGDPNGDGSGGSSIFGATFADEINANTYGLQNQTLKDLAQGQPLPPNLQGKENMTVKQYYESNGYVYNNNLPSMPMKRGVLAMANRGPNTNGSQFFIVTAENTPWLDGKHTVFGTVTAGMDVVDAITSSNRDANDRPLSPITFSAEVVN